MKKKSSYAPLYYFDVESEWGHLRVGPLLIHWFNSSAEHDSWGSCDITWDLKHSFLFFFNELSQRFEFSHRIIDPDIRRVMKGVQHF